MSKVVTIPKDRNPFVVIVNGVKHSYPAGVTTEVPDEVADVIEKYVGAKPKPDPNANAGGGVSSWNDLKDRPFYEETKTVNEPLNITWDGNTDGLVSCGGDDGSMFYKISDDVFSDEQLKLMTASISSGQSILLGDIWNAQQGIFVSEDITYALAVVSVRKEGAVVYGATFPEKGLYFPWFPGVYTSALTTTEPIEHTETVVKTIDTKYLPSGLGGDSTMVVTASTEDYENYTVDKTFAEIKAHIDSGYNVVARLWWTPFPNSAGNEPSLYVLPLYTISETAASFATDSDYPSLGRMILNVDDDGEVYVGTNLNLPYPDKKGACLVGLDTFNWEIADAPIVYSPNGTKYKITVSDNGTLTATKV